MNNQNQINEIRERWADIPDKWIVGKPVVDGYPIFDTGGDLLFSVDFIDDDFLTLIATTPTDIKILLDEIDRLKSEVRDE